MFTLDHADDSIPELCVGYLARNFMRVMSCSSFGDIPYELLYHCVQRTDLTIDSEKHLSEALIVWLAANADRSKRFGSNYEEHFVILKEIRVSLLPLWFVAGGKRTCPYFSGLAVQSISRILSLLKDPSTGYQNVLDFVGDDLRIRLTEFSEKMNLSGCPQITSAVLLFSLLPRNHNTNSSLRIPIDQPLMKLEGFLGFPNQTSDKSLPTLSYEAVVEVDISKCTRLNIDAAINCFSKSFPSLRILKAAYCPNFRLTSLHNLVVKCSSIDEVDLSTDISPIPWTKSLAWSHSPASRKTGYSLAYVSGFEPHISVERLQNISILTLEGRSDVTG
ncbi:BTB/Kelch-associated [Dillenia turbinata]|uniref:BTB/Kelch-associated n=1 Tax=Dillenia turbinata TaxID=194707 RepID=A0AAN8W273_9MAGN